MSFNFDLLALQYFIIFMVVLFFYTIYDAICGILYLVTAANMYIFIILFVFVWINLKQTQPPNCF